MTQREGILALLREAGENGLCSLAAYRHGARFYNSRNRVSEMNRDGYRITSDPCKHDEDTPSHVRWTLVSEPVRTAEPSHRGGGRGGSAVRTGLRREEAVAAIGKAGRSTAQPPVADQLALIGGM